MPTLKDYFETDFKQYPTAGRELVIPGVDREGKPIEAKVSVRAHFEFDSGTKFNSFYVPTCYDPLGLMRVLLQDRFRLSAEDFGGLIPVAQIGFPGEEARHSKDLRFSGRIYIYSENELSSDELAVLKGEAAQRNLFVQFRGPSYAKERTANEVPLAFISHDSRDKKTIAGPLALELRKRGCPVWYDEFSLKVGDSLRESIERGIKVCRKCIVILTPRFLSNKGWTKVEFNSVFLSRLLSRIMWFFPFGIVSQNNRCMTTLLS
ncbi:MAG TPA: toll/interleukin-1 receptor domain-containing protein [Pyrinomonadaceae bacterium]|nr:toll/interleukin-1 receptor domain-containing protein [Pyrinomonadaceae bacterium]